MGNHTPGPWRVDTSGGAYIGYIVAGEGDDETTLAEVERWPFGNDADSRLMAAAPQMLEALQRCFVWLGANTPIEVDELVEKAIKAATGEEV